jgi:hypothetical protein
MKVRKLKRAFHGRFLVVYAQREIWVGKGNRVWKYLSYGTAFYNGKPPTLP